MNRKPLTWRQLLHGLGALEGHLVAVRIVHADEPKRLLAVMEGRLGHRTDNRLPSLFWPVHVEGIDAQVVEQAGVLLHPDEFAGGEERAGGTVLLIVQRNVTVNIRSLATAPAATPNDERVSVVPIQDPYLTVVAVGARRPAIPQLARGVLVVPVGNVGNVPVSAVGAVLRTSDTARETLIDHDLLPGCVEGLVFGDFPELPSFTLMLEAAGHNGAKATVSATFDVAERRYVERVTAL